MTTWLTPDRAEWLLDCIHHTLDDCYPTLDLPHADRQATMVALCEVVGIEPDTYHWITS